MRAEFEIEKIAVNPVRIERTFLFTNYTYKI